MASHEMRKNTAGVAWSAIERFALQGSQFIVSLILARLLLPSDYGLIAMMSIFIAISTSLIDCGMAQSLIQRINHDERDRTTALTTNILFSIGIYSIIYFTAPAIAHFYGVEELCSVARIYSLVLIINSLSVVQQALITIELNFKRQAIASLTGVIIGGVIAVIMAYKGFGVWALVAQQIISSLVLTSLLWVMARWRPTGHFSWESFRTLSSFGSKIMFSGLLHVIYTNLYTLIIGKRFAQAELGLYNRATTISALPSSNISTIVDRALYPILCKSQDNCEAATESMFRYLRIVCFFVFPVMVGVAIMAQPLTLVLLGDRWGDVTPLLQGVAIANMWDPVMKFMGSMIRSQGRSADFLRAETLKKICGIAILIISVPYGVIAMCWGLVAYAFMDMFIIILFARRITPKLGYISVISQLLPTILTTALMGGVVYAISLQTLHLGALLQLTIAFVVGSTIFLGVGAATHRPELREIIKIIREHLPQNRTEL